MTLSHKIELDPTSEQESALVRACGCSRFAYNWGLSRWKELKAAGVPKVSIQDLKKEFNALKRSQFPWIYESPKDANQQAFSDLQKSLRQYFTSKGSPKKQGFVGYRTRSKSMGFYMANDKAFLSGHALKLQVIGTVKTKEAFRWPDQSLKIQSFRISRYGGKWWVSVVCEGDFRTKPCLQGELGIDLGLKDFLVSSDGTRVQAHKAYQKSERTLSRKQRKLVRKKKGSKNRDKAKRRLQKAHYRVRCIRQDFLHKTSRKLVQENQLIAIENLNVASLAKTGLAKSILDAGWSEFVRQLEYKSLQTGTVVWKIGRFFPSTKTCHVCGFVNNSLTLADRTYVCPSCGVELDRDLNASQNILREARRELELPMANGEVTPVERRTPALVEEASPLMEAGNQCELTRVHI